MPHKSEEGTQQEEEEGKSEGAATNPEGYALNLDFGGYF